MHFYRFMLILLLITLLVFSCNMNQPDPQYGWIRINQMGYRPADIKVAVLCSKDEINCKTFTLHDAGNDRRIAEFESVKACGAYGPFQSSYRLDFSAFETGGKYYLSAGKVKSSVFEISSDIYNGSADFLLKYMRQQRCGFNPFLKDSCHTDDGYTLYGPMPDGTCIDVRGGWHDAADYLQYVATSANATFNLLFAYRENPHGFIDSVQYNGLAGPNGVPDVLDEARWGLDWLLKMHPRPDRMFNQIADDRDHAGFRLPNHDTVKYDYKCGRPVYFCSGEPQGLFDHKNRSTGTASTAGKFASAFALGAKIFESSDPEYSALLKRHARSAYQFGKAKPGYCQTAPCKAPYFYEEESWADDMELGAAALYHLTGNPEYLTEAGDFAGQARHTPWMGSDTARHYQWYPFINIGHFELARRAGKNLTDSLIHYYRNDIESVYARGKNNPFLMGVPFIWCSANLTAAFVTQCRLYQIMASDSTYLELEAAMRDWLFGCNPWGVSMIVGLPENGVYPRDPHSSLAHLYNYKPDGGLIDGPVYGSIYKNLKYLHLTASDKYAPFQSDLAVYHDDVGDYSSNEPTMDGTATLIYYLASLAGERPLSGSKKKAYSYNHGAIIRGDASEKEIALVFTGDQYADGGPHIREVLNDRKIKASFFLTGNFYRNPDFQDLIKKLSADGHYLSAHSDKHLLYCDWEKRDSLLISKNEFLEDLENNYAAMRPFGIEKNDARFFLPPYEWYNRTIGKWTTEAGLTLINFTPGTRSNADYTIPSMNARYVSSQEIFESILQFEDTRPNKLNGFILLLHIGTHPERKDKFYLKLDTLVTELQYLGYRFSRIDRMLGS